MAQVREDSLCVYVHTRFCDKSRDSCIKQTVESINIAPIGTQDAQENVVLKEGQINDLLSQATELKVQQAAAEQKIQRLERSMQGMHQDVLELTKDRNTIQLVVAQKEGEEKVCTFAWEN